MVRPDAHQAADAAALITAHQSPPAATSSAAPARDGGTGQVLADAGYCSEDNLTTPGPDRLIATGTRRTLEKIARQATAASQDHTSGQAADGPSAAMAARLATEEGITAYRRRATSPKPPTATSSTTWASAAEWAFTAAVHNLLKAITTGHLTLTALTTLAS